MLEEKNAMDNFDAKIAELEKETNEVVPEVTTPEVTPAPEIKEPEKETPAPEVTPKEEVKPEEVKPELNADGTPKVAPKIEAPAYVPNKEFNVKGKKHSFDPAFDSMLTSKENEEKIRQLHAKAYGLEEVQASRDKIRAEYETVQKDLETISPARNLYGKAMEYKAKGDQESFVNALAASISSVYTDQEIIDTANKLLDKYITPEKKASVERDLNYHKNVVASESRVQSIESRELTLEATNVNREVNFYLENPEIKAVKDFYDGIHGEGKFRDKIFAEGHRKSTQAGVIAYPVAKNIEEICSEYRPFAPKMANPAPAAGQQATPPKETVNKVVAPNTDGKIPNIPSAGSAGRTSAIKSKEDLEKLIEKTEAEIKGE